MKEKDPNQKTLLDSALNEMLLGNDNDEDDLRIMDKDTLLKINRFLGIFDFDQNDFDDSDSDQGDDIFNQSAQEELIINEPFLDQIEIPDNMTATQYLKLNPSKRTLLRQIAIRNSLLSGQSSITRHSAAVKYPIYSFSDLIYAPNTTIRQELDQQVMDILFRNRRNKIFDQDYYDQLLSNFSVLNEQQIKDHIQQTKESEQILEQVKKQKNLKNIEAKLAKYTETLHESRDQYFILSQDNIQYNPLENEKSVVSNILTNPSFFKELESILMKKKVKIQKEQKIEIEINYDEQLENMTDQQQIEHTIRQNDRGLAAKVFAKKYQLCEQQLNTDTFEFQNTQIKTHPPVQSYVNFMPKYSKVFKFWGQVDDAGLQLQQKIIGQLEQEKKKEQAKDSQNQQDEQQEIEEDKRDIEFDNYVREQLYYNKDIVDFCENKKTNFLTLPFQALNRVEIDMTNNQFFSEKLEMLLHLKKPIEKKVVSNYQPIRGGAPSIISKQFDKKSIISKSKFSNTQHDDDDDDSADMSDDDEQIHFEQQNMNQSFFEDNTNSTFKELTALIDSKIKNRFQEAKIMNSQVAESFNLNDFTQDVSKYKNYHRSDLLEILYLEKEVFYGLEREKVRHFDPWHVSLEPLSMKKGRGKEEKEVLLEEMPEMVHSQEHYKSLQRLSLTKGNFILLEYIEQRPIVLNNTGMCIRATRHVYGQRALNQFQRLKDRRIGDYQLQQQDDSDIYGLNQEKQISQEEQNLLDFKHLLVEKLGKIGQIKFLEKTEQIPLQGQLFDERIIGITVIENELYRAPVFRQKLSTTDFLLVRYREEECQYKYVLRPIDCIYLVGQIEPKAEIYTPHSRPLGSFQKNYLSTYIKKQFREDKEVNSETLNAELFQKKQSIQNIRQALKNCKGEPDQFNPKIWKFKKSIPSEDAQVLRYEVTSIQICLYEAMLHSSYLLQQFGLKELKNSDKMKKTLQAFLTRHPNDFEDWVIAKRIEDELNMTAWSLSASFQRSANQTGKMLLYGIGDPTSGHGGLSYIKKPLKARGEKAQNAIVEKKPSVMGTDNDLRRLHVEEISAILGKLGIQCGNLKRWKMINLLTRKIQEAQNPDNADTQWAIIFRKNLELLSSSETKNLEVIIKYAKNQRLTTKKQKEQYQKELDSLLNCLIQNLQLSVQSNHYQGFAEIGRLRIKRQLAADDKNKDLEYNGSDIEPYLITNQVYYKLKLQAFLNKEKKIWLDKKKKKGLM